MTRFDVQPEQGVLGLYRSTGVPAGTVPQLLTFPQSIQNVANQGGDQLLVRLQDDNDDRERSWRKKETENTKEKEKKKEKSSQSEKSQCCTKIDSKATIARRIAAIGLRALGCTAYSEREHEKEERS